MPKPTKITKPTISRALAPDHYWKLTTLHERKKQIVNAAAPHQQALRECQAALDGLMPAIESALKDAGLDPTGVYAFNDADLTATPQDTAPK